MNEYNALKDAIRAAIKPNGEYALTAQVFQNILIAIVDSFGKGYQFMGIATADTEPGEPDEKEFYVGFAGEYANFGEETITVPLGGVAIFLYDTSWHVNVVKVAERVAVSGNHLEIDGARSIIEQDIVNVNTLTSQGEAFLTAAAARAAVSAESGLRIGGQVITYLVEIDEEHHTAWVVDQFTGDDAEGWENDDNWHPFLYVELAKIVSNQTQINEAIMEALANRYTKEQVDGMIEPLSERMGAAEEGLAAEILRAQAAESRLQDIYEGLTQNPVIVGPLPSSGQADTIYRVPGTSSYSDYMWNGTQFVLMATYSDGRLDFINVNLLNATGSTPHAAYATADAARADISAASGLRALGLQITYLLTDGVWYTDQYIGTDISGWSTASNWKTLGPVSVTQNTLSIGGEEKGELAGQLIENPDYLDVKTDSDGRLLEAIEKEDGSKVFGSNVKAKGTFNGVNLRPDKDVVDKEIAEMTSLIDNPDYVGAETDADGRILEATRKSDGCKIFHKVEAKGMKAEKIELGGSEISPASTTETFDLIEDAEKRLEIDADKDGKIISERDEDGKLHEYVGIETKQIETDGLHLSNSAMSEFQQALKDSGFQPGGAGDWSDKESMYISTPRLAHLNLITDFNLLDLTKTSDVKCQVEFFDGFGNYFKKWIILNGQGRSSLQFVKKGLGADFFNENPNDPNFDDDNVFTMKFGDWVSQDSFHIKSFYTDFPRCTTPVVYKLANEVALTRGILEDRPYKKYYVGGYTDSANGSTEPSDIDKNIETGARCIPDGFPVIVYQNGEFWGVNSWQLKKHRDNYQLSKKKDSNIHLDGDMHGKTIEGVTYPSFWLWNGTIHWPLYCSGVYGIETRNPKNLYCVDGKKYDADTHDMEIIDIATAEEWIAAGQIIPTGKVIDDTLAGYLRTTGKVRKNIEDLTTYVPYINGLIDGSILIDGQQATTEQIKAAIEDRFDVNSFIDYIVVNNVVGNTDAWCNNGQIITWGKLGESDNLNWSVNYYDCDVTFGCVFNGTIANAANNEKLGIDDPLCGIFWNYYLADMKSRYAKLRADGIFDAAHITQLFRDWMDRVGFANYEKEYKKWSQSPCFRENRNDYTLNPTSGGFYGSIYRIYLWIKKRIEYMDGVNFFDYNN